MRKTKPRNNYVPGPVKGNLYLHPWSSKCISFVCEGKEYHLGFECDFFRGVHRIFVYTKGVKCETIIITDYWPDLLDRIITHIEWAWYGIKDCWIDKIRKWF